MDIETVNQAVLDAVRDFCRPYDGPCELSHLEEHRDKIFTSTFNDIRKSQSGGPVFSVDIDPATYSTATEVRDYVKGRILSYFRENAN